MPEPTIDTVILAKTSLEQYKDRVLIDAITKLKLLCEEELLRLKK